MARENIIPVFLPGIGCPGRCIFCNQRLSGADTELPSSDEVDCAIRKGLSCCAGVPELAFFGGSFTALSIDIQRMLLSAALPYIEGGSLSGVRVSTRPDAINPEVLDLLSRFGVKTIEIGAESMDDDVLAAALRGHTSVDTRNAAKLIKSAGMSLILQMMVGLPLEKPGSAIKTALAIAELKPDGVRIFPTVVLQNTRLFELWQRGEYVPLTLEKAADVCAELVEIFETVGIPVIRLGLNPTDTLSHGGVAAGPYHPAFGEIVRSRGYYSRAAELLRGVPEGADVKIYVNPACVSLMSGQGRENKIKLCQKFGLSGIKIIPRGEILPGPRYITMEY